MTHPLSTAPTSRILAGIHALTHPRSRAEAALRRTLLQARNRAKVNAQLASSGLSDDLSEALDIARAMACDADHSTGTDLAHALTSASEAARDLTLALAAISAPRDVLSAARDTAREIARLLTPAWDLAHTLAIAQQLGHGHDRARDCARETAQRILLDLEPTLSRTRQLQLTGRSSFEEPCL